MVIRNYHKGGEGGLHIVNWDRVQIYNLYIIQLIFNLQIFFPIWIKFSSALQWTKDLKNNVFILIISCSSDNFQLFLSMSFSFFSIFRAPPSVQLTKLGFWSQENLLFSELLKKNVKNVKLLKFIYFFLLKSCEICMQCSLRAWWFSWSTG